VSRYLGRPFRTLDVLIPSGLRCSSCTVSACVIRSGLHHYFTDIHLTVKILITKLPEYSNSVAISKIDGIRSNQGYPVALKEPKEIKSSPGQHPGASCTTVDVCYTDGRPCIFVRPLCIYVMTTVCHSTSILLVTPENAGPPVSQSQRYSSSSQTLSSFQDHGPRQC
jgi:hypothetical protein